MDDIPGTALEARLSGDFYSDFDIHEPDVTLPPTVSTWWPGFSRFTLASVGIFLLLAGLVVRSLLEHTKGGLVKRTTNTSTTATRTATTTMAKTATRTATTTMAMTATTTTAPTTKHNRISNHYHYHTSLRTQDTLLLKSDLPKNAAHVFAQVGLQSMMFSGAGIKTMVVGGNRMEQPLKVNIVVDVDTMNWREDQITPTHSPGYGVETSSLVSIILLVAEKKAYIHRKMKMSMMKIVHAQDTCEFRHVPDLRNPEDIRRCIDEEMFRWNYSTTRNGLQLVQLREPFPKMPGFVVEGSIRNSIVFDDMGLIRRMERKEQFTSTQAGSTDVHIDVAADHVKAEKPDPDIFHGGVLWSVCVESKPPFSTDVLPKSPFGECFAKCFRKEPPDQLWHSQPDLHKNS